MGDMERKALKDDASSSGSITKLIKDIAYRKFMNWPNKMYQFVNIRT